MAIYKNKEYEIILESPPSESSKINITNQIEKFNLQKKPSFDNKSLPYGFFIKDKTELLGGIIGEIWMGSLHIHRLFLREELRRKGLGSRLLKCAEEFGKLNCCNIATLESLSFQKAVEFYKKHNYQLVYEDKGYNDNLTIYFMRKVLCS